LIVNWGTMGTPEFTSRFEKEIQVSADGLTVWLPIQESLMREFGQEATAGAPLNVWIITLDLPNKTACFL